MYCCQMASVSANDRLESHRFYALDRISTTAFIIAIYCVFSKDMGPARRGAAGGRWHRGSGIDIWEKMLRRAAAAAAVSETRTG